MSAATVLESIRALGLRVRLDKGVLLVSPKGKVTPKLVEYIRQHRPAILQALAELGLNDLAELGRSRWAECPLPLELEDWVNTEAASSLMARTLAEALQRAGDGVDLLAFEQLMDAARGLWLRRKAGTP